MNSPTPSPAPEGPNPAPSSGDAPANDEESQIQHVGTATALILAGIPIDPDFGKRPYSQRITVVDADGRAWEVWSDGFFAQARRTRTEAERLAWVDDSNARITSSFFSIDRQAMAARIAYEINLIASSPLPRSGRRAIKAKLAVFAAVQLELFGQRDVDMAALRARLAAVGLEIKQLPYMH